MDQFIFFCVTWFAIMQATSKGASVGGSSDVLRVQTGQSLTLNSNMRNRYEVSWYRLRSEELVLLISGEKDITGRKLLTTFNPNSNRMRMTTDGWVTRASLVISGVTEADSGLYFCGTKSNTTEMHFDKPVRLEIEDPFTELPRKLDITDEVTERVTGKEVKVTVMKAVTETKAETETDMERMLTFGCIGLAVFVFFLAVFVTGGLVHHHGWKKGWEDGKRIFQDLKSAK